jgi:hypothetical protein
MILMIAIVVTPRHLGRGTHSAPPEVADLIILKFQEYNRAGHYIANAFASTLPCHGMPIALLLRLALAAFA